MSEQSNQVNYQSDSISVKDLMVPLSIVLAGLFVGAGLYFGGNGAVPLGAGDQLVGDPTFQEPAPAAQVEEADNTDRVAEVTPEDHIKGDINAPIMIVEYSDFDCPFCSRFHTTMDQVIAANDDVAWVYRHFPLDQLHPQAAAVSAASECVAELAGSDAFWSFTDGYFALRGAGDQRAHGVVIPELALAAGVSQAAFTECFESGRTQELVQEDLQNAIATGGRGTPWSVLIGPTGKTYPINGALPQTAVEQLIEIARQEA